LRPVNRRGSMAQAQVRIRRIEFSNFKALGSYSLSLQEVNILVGPNNSGKSTVIGALRTLDAAVRTARSRAPTRLHVGDETLIGYRIPEESVPISLENVQTDYNGAESRVTFHLSNRNTLTLIFPDDGGCVLLPILDGGVVNSAAVFKREFPINLVIVPVLGPVEHLEQRRERGTVVASLSTHRASRHFRSFWHYNPDGFDTFAELVARTWPGTVDQPTSSHTAPSKWRIDVCATELGASASSGHSGTWEPSPPLPPLRSLDHQRKNAERWLGAFRGGEGFGTHQTPLLHHRGGAITQSRRSNARSLGRYHGLTIDNQFL